MAAGLTGETYGLVVLSYSTLAFVKFGTDIIVTRMTLSMADLEKQWTCSDGVDFKKTGPSSSVEKLRKKFDLVRVRAQETESNDTYENQYASLIAILFVCAAILLFSVLDRFSPLFSPEFTIYGTIFNVENTFTYFEAGALSAAYILFIVTLAKIVKKVNTMRESVKSVNAACIEVSGQIEVAVEVHISTASKIE